VRRGLALMAVALLLPDPAWAQIDDIEFSCMPVVGEAGKTRLVDSPQFASFDLTHPGATPVQLPPATIGILCTRLSLVPFAEDYLLLRRGLKLYIQVDEDRPAHATLLLEAENGVARYSMYAGEASELERIDIEAAIGRFPPL